MMVWKTRRQLSNSSPRTELPMSERPWREERAWGAMIEAWDSHRKRSSMKTPRYWTLDDCLTLRDLLPGT